MSDTLIVGLLSLVGTSVGTIGGIIASQKLVSYRLAQLEEKVNKHNNVIERMFIAEGQIRELEHDVRELKGRN